MTISADSPEARSRRLSRALDLEGEDFLPLRAMVEAAGRLARAATDTGSLDRAERVWRALDLLAPEDPAASLGRAEAWLAQGNSEKASEYATIAVRARNQTPDGLAFGYTLLARAAAGRGHDDHAAAALERAREVAPGSGWIDGVEPGAASSKGKR